MNSTPQDYRSYLSSLARGRRRVRGDASCFDGSCRREGRLRIASYNVHKCIGTDGAFDPARTAAVIAEIGADIIALQEADRRLGSREGRLNLTLLEHETGLRLVPVSARPASHGWHGNALFVRQGTIRRIERLDLPHAEPRGAILVEIDLPATPLRIVAAHLGLLRQTRRAQLERLARAIEKADPMPTLLMGDFNEWRPFGTRSPFLCLEPLFGPIEAHIASFPSGRPLFPLDRIFVRPQQLMAAFAVHDTPLARRASDHLPVKAELDLASVRAMPSPPSP